MDDDALKSAREALSSGKFPEAAAILEPVHKRWPKHAETAHALALAYAQTGLKDKALKVFEKLVALSPKDGTARLNYGTALSQCGRGADAAAAFREAIALAPQLSGAHYNLAIELSKTGDLQGAANAMREAARLNPDAGVFQRELARIEGQLGHWEAAIAAYRACCASEECHLDARTELALALEKAGLADESLAEWRSLLLAAPLLPTARHHLVAELARRGDLEEAERTAAAGTESDPANADFWHNLGTIRSMKDDPAGAVAAFRRALLADPARPETAQNAAATLDVRTAPNPDVEHANPFDDSEEHRIGVLTFRAHSDDDLSRALAHALPALLADRAATTPARARHVAPFTKGEPRRADILFDYMDRDASHLAGLTRSIRAERWIFGEIAPDLAAVRVRLWTAGSASEQSEDVPLDPRDPAAALRQIAKFAGLELAPDPLPSPRDILHFGLGATSVVEDLALEHLLSALRSAPFAAAETEFLRLVLDFLRRGDPPGALGWLERLLAIRPSPRGTFAKGQALFASGQFDLSRDAWAEATRLDPALRAPLLPFGWLELKAGRLPEAEAYFTEAMSDGDSAAAALVGLGCIQMARRDAAAARARFLEALERAPRMPEALFQIALSYWAEGNREEAVRWGGRLEAHHEGNGLVAALARIMGWTKGLG